MSREFQMKSKKRVLRAINEREERLSFSLFPCNTKWSGGGPRFFKLAEKPEAERERHRGGAARNFSIALSRACLLRSSIFSFRGRKEERNGRNPMKIATKLERAHDSPSPPPPPPPIVESHRGTGIIAKVAIGRRERRGMQAQLLVRARRRKKRTREQERSCRISRGEAGRSHAHLNERTRAFACRKEFLVPRQSAQRSPRT